MEKPNQNTNTEPITEPIEPLKEAEKESREAIAWFEESKAKQKEILESSTSKKRGYITTNYELSKGERGKQITREEYEQQQRVLQALEKTSQYLAVETDITTILEKIAETVATALGAKQATFWDFTPDKKGAFIIAAYGIQEQYIKHSKKDPLPIGGAWLGRAMSTGQVWTTSDIQKDPVLPKSWLPAVKKQDYHGLLCAPLMRKNEIIGGMCIYHKDIHEYQFFEINVMTIVANQAATALENSRIFNDLKTERNKTFAVIQSLNDGLIMFDIDGKIIFFNPKAQEFLLVELKDVIGKKIDEQFKNKNVYLKNLYNIVNLVQTDYSTKEYTTEGPQKLILEVIQIPVRDQKNIKIGTARILHDVTAERASEQLKTRFVSIASHQLRTPLSGMKWSLEVLMKEEAGQLNEKQKELIGHMTKTNFNLITLINDLLDVSRIEEGRFGYEFIIGDLIPLTEKVINDSQPTVIKNKLFLTFEKPEETLPQVSFDAKKFQIVIQNILENALKYTKEGGYVKVKLRKEQSSLFLIIEDNGIGIPKKDHKLVFNKFFRAENAIRFQTEGSGLGLYIAKSIVEKHNGLIHFESEENKGTTFMVQLPLDPEKMPKGKIEEL